MSIDVRWSALTLLVGLGLEPSLAVAAPHLESSFAIPAGPMADAATRFALQAGVSIESSASARCGPSRGFAGRASPDRALAAILAGTGCAARRLDDRAYQIIALPRAKPAAPPRPSPQVTAVPPPNPVPRQVDLSAVVIVATRRPALADRLGDAVSVVSGRSIEQQGLHDSNDLALVVPAMTVTNLGAGRDKVILRGLSDGPLTGQTQAMAGLYLDDVRLTYNAPDPDLLLIDIHQVEVLRGPQGALYGSGSLAGIVQLRSNAPDASAFDAWAAAGLSLTQYGSPSELVSGMLNLPVGGHGAALRLAAYAQGQGGYIDDVGRGRSDVNSTQREGLRLSLTSPLRGDWKVNAGIVSQSIAAGDTQYAEPAVGAYARIGRIAQPHDNDFLEAHLEISGLLAGRPAKIVAAGIRHEFDSRYDASGSPPVATSSGAALAFDDRDQIASNIVEGSIASAPGARLQWQAGVFLGRTRQDRKTEFVQVAPAARPSAQETRRDLLQEAAVFGQVTAPLGHGWSLTLGSRLFASRIDVNSHSATSSVAGQFRDETQTVGFAPKAVVTFMPNDGLLFYAQAAEGYRSAGYNTALLVTQPFYASGADPQRRYGGDELWNFEGGAKVAMLSGRLRLRGAIFRSKWRNVQSDQLLPSGLPFTANIGTGGNLGIEGEGELYLDRLTVRMGLLFDNPELERVNPAFPGHSDLALAAAPSSTASLSVGYAWPLGDEDGLQLDGRIAYVGASRLNFDTATTPRMGDYTITRAAAALDRGRWRCTLSVDNLLGVAGNTFAYGNPFILKSTPQTTPLRPRTITLEIRARY